MSKQKLQRSKKPKSQRKQDKAERDRKKQDSPTKQEDRSDTVFLRNLSFETEEDNLKQFIEKNFGETVYCLICRDKETDESKGTAFVKFKDHENATKCLKEFKDRDLQTKFHLDGRNLMIFPALSRDHASNIKNDDKKGKDKRNLALAREGFIHPMSEEAKEISKSDLEKRKILQKRKKDLLNNLHNFVSDVRLCIHNLPPHIDDTKLRKIFMDKVKKDNNNPKILECRVMRNKKGSGDLSSSKGFGFVAFSKHEHALDALKAINNNPNIFSKDRRPIVEFSIENLVALNKKKKRLVNSQRKLKTIKEDIIKKDVE